jgi:hypothetical protein
MEPLGAAATPDHGDKMACFIAGAHAALPIFHWNPDCNRSPSTYLPSAQEATGTP